MSAPVVAVIGNNRQLDALTPLRAEYHRRGIGEVAVLTRTLRPPEAGREVADGVAAVLMAYPRLRAPSTVVPWPAAVTARGRRIPIGIVPDHRESLQRFALAAAEVHARADRSDCESSVALLAQRSRRYLDLAGRIRRLLGESGRAPDSVFWWPADEIVRADLTLGLGQGLAVALYVGHGRPSGWVGYTGVRAHHLADVPSPGALIVSLACQTLNRRRVGLSFGERLVAQGSVAASIGAVSVTRHIANARWSLRFVDAVAAGSATVGDLIVAAEPDVEAGRVYRLVGDPLAPLLDAPGARNAAQVLTDDVTYSPAREGVPA